ncbi:TPA: hypothetical protein ACH3X2_008311 [Trebouxia sp. C0005]
MAMRYYCIFKSRNAHVCVVLALLGACTVPRPCRSRANRALLLSPALSAWNLTLGNGSGLSDSVAPNEQRYRSATIKKTSPASRSSHIPIRLPNCKLITAAGAAEQQPLPSFANLQSVRKLLASSCSGQYSQGYTVQPGDFLSKIAASCSLSLLQLESANSQITDPNLIHPGDTVCVPSTCSIGRRLLYSHDLKTAAHSSTFARQLAESPCSGQYAKAYSVRQGDILNTIASACNVTLPQLEAANTQITEFDMIQPGNTVCVPPACSKALRIPLSQDTTPPPCSGQFAGSYAIRTGDSLNDIATACRVTLADLEAANTQLTDFDTIQPGTPVCVLPSCTAFLQSAPTAAAAQQSPTAASPLATFTAPPSSPLPPVGSPPPAVVAEGGPSPA